MTDNELFKKIKFAEDHIKDFNKAKINAWGKVLVGEGIENPENLRITLKHLNYPLKSKVAEFVESNRWSKDIKIQNQIKNWKSFFNRTGQAFLTGEFEKGTIHGLTGNISLEKQFKNLGLNVTKILDASGNEKLKIKIAKVLNCPVGQLGKAEGGRIGFAFGSGDPTRCITSKLEADPKGTLSKIIDGVPEIRAPLAQTLGPDGWRFLGVDYDDPGRIGRLLSKAGEGVARSPTAIRTPLQLTGKLATGVGRFLADPFFFPLIPVEMMVASAYGFEKNKDEIMKSLKDNPFVSEMAKRYNMSAEDVRNAVLEKYRRAVLNAEGGL